MFIIADVGSNWENLDDCFKSVELAALAGANAVKFQLYNYKGLYGYDGEYGFGGDKFKSLPRSWIPELYKMALECKIEFMVTPFDHEDIDWLNQYVHRWKIASSDVTYSPLLKKVAATNKQVILSTGASTLDEIRNAVSLLSDFCLLYCVSAYPSTAHDLNYMDLLSEEFKCKVGYSDHTTDIYQPAYCAKYHYGAHIYEKHFKIRKMDTPDNGHSLMSYDFKSMVERLDTIGPEKWRENYEERGMRIFHNRRIVATEEIAPGDELVVDKNCGLYRTKFLKVGVPIVDPEKASGKHVKRKILKGESVTENDI